MIRPIEPADVDTVLALIHELAEYELEPDAVEAGAAELHDAFFADTPQVFAHVAVADGRVVGVAVWHLNFSTWTGRHGIHLVDLVVTARARADGHGAALFDTLAGLCVERGYRRLDWEVADAVQRHPDRRGPHGFYRLRGGVPRPGWTGWRLDAAALRALDGRARLGSRAMDLDIIEDADVDEQAVLLVTGSVDLSSRDKLLAAGRESLARDDVQGLVLDVAGVGFLDSTGIGAFVDLSRDAEDRGAAFAIRNPSPRVRRLVDLIGMTDVWTAPSG